MPLLIDVELIYFANMSKFIQFYVYSERYTMSTMNKEINKISKTTYSVLKATFELISSVYNWLVME